MTASLRLLFISNFYPPHDIGGYEMHCQEVADGLRQRGHDVKVLTSRHSVGAAVQEDHIRRALYLESDLRRYSPVHFFLHRSQEEHYNADVVLSTIADTRPDAILVWGMWNLSRRVPSVVESSGIPMGYWFGDSWPLDPDTHRNYWRSSAGSQVGRLFMRVGSKFALQKLARESYPPVLHFRHTACGSEFLKRRLAAQIPSFQAAKIILCGIDLKAFAGYQPHSQLIDPIAPRIVYVGGLGPHKGVHTAIEAMARMLNQNSTLHPVLTIVGGGHPDYETRLRQLAQDAGIAERVQFKGTAPKDVVPSLLSEHDILVVPSVWDEPFGRVVAEGMAAGLVVVGTATGGSAEVLVDQVNGLVFPVENAGALAECLSRLTLDPALYARLAEAGKETARRFDLQHMIDGIERFLIGLVTHDGPRTVR